MGRKIFFPETLKFEWKCAEDTSILATWRGATWEGNMIERAELIQELRSVQAERETAEIVAAALDQIVGGTL